MGKKKNYNECLTTPFETGIRNFSQVANYFMYYSPYIDSAQSKLKLELETANRINEQFKNDFNKDSYRILKKLQPASFTKLDFDNDFIDFEKPRVLCNKYSYENDLQALLRHIRNSLAHGYVFVWKKKSGNYIFLIDFDTPKNNKPPKATAKILVSMNILEKWKAILENQIAIGE